MSDSFKNIDRITEDLADSSLEPKNWKGILIAFLVISSICTVISLTIFLLSPHFGLKGKSERIKLEQIISEELNINRFNLSWVSNTELTYLDFEGNLVIYDIESKLKTILASNTSLRQIKFQKFSISQDRRYILLVHDIKKINSFSYKAKYKVYDTQSSLIISLKVNDNDQDSELLQYAEWGPRSSQLILLYENNIIYYHKYGDKPVAITNSNKKEWMFNGIPDILYEEYILRSNKAFWWNSDGSKLCFASFDNSLVNQMPIVIYGSYTNFTEEKYSVDPSIDLVYPKVIKYPFPKPGRANPLVNLWIADIKFLPVSLKKVTLPDQIKYMEHYLLNVNWIDSNKISVIWSKRTHNYTIVSVCDEFKYWKCEMLLEERLSSTHGWLDINHAPLFSKDYSHYFIMLPVADGSLGTFQQIVMYTMNENKKYHLTHGSYVVTKILAHRSDLHKVFYLATMTGEPRVRHVFSVTDIQDTNPRKVNCLSCEIPECSYFNVLLSPNDQYFILECLGPGIPRTEIRVLETNQLIEVFNTFSRLQEQLNLVGLPRIEYLSLSLDGNHFARIRILLPPDLDEEDTLKYPLVIRINSEPEEQSVNYLNHFTWEHYLASKKEYVVANVDVRGSNYQGDKYKQSIYHHLAEYETLDLIQVARYLKHHLTYIDEDKIAIWGTEIGGYIVVSLMIRDPTFNCGIAVAPVTNWRNYASYPIEKYMGSPWPKENFIYYDKSDLFRNLELIKEKEFMIIHGTADYKVNIQHSMLLMKALTDLAVPFRVQIYPGADHSFADDKLHFTKTMEDFFSKCFQLEDEENQIELPITKVIKGGKRTITGDD